MLTGVTKRSLSVLLRDVNERSDSAQGKSLPAIDDIKQRLAAARGKRSYKEVAALLNDAGYRLPGQEKPVTDVSVRAYELPVGSDGGTDKVPVDYVLAFAGAVGVDLAEVLPGAVWRVQPPVALDPASPWAGSYIGEADAALRRMDGAPYPLRLKADVFGDAYTQALAFRWPIEEVRQLDSWRDATLQQLGYEPERHPVGRAWEKLHLPFGHDLGDILDYIEKTATPGEMAALKMRGMWGGPVALTDDEKAAIDHGTAPALVTPSDVGGDLERLDRLNAVRDQTPDEPGGSKRKVRGGEQ